MGALMKGVVAHMSQDDMLAIASYVGSLTPGSEESSSSASGIQALASLAAGAQGQKAAK
jgi:cytochrome c553